jgi:hypothetical protein
MRRVATLVSVLLATLITACATPEPDVAFDGVVPPDWLVEQDAALAQAPPPATPMPPVVQPQLSVTPLVAGQLATVTVTGVAHRGVPVRFGLSTVGAAPGTGPCVVPGLCLDITSPALLLARVTSNPRGTAAYTFRVPANPSFSDVWFQAVVGDNNGSPVTTNVVSEPVAGITPPGGPVCGMNTCNAGDVCCNASCGICTPPGGFCIQLACTP